MTGHEMESGLPEIPRGVAARLDDDEIVLAAAPGAQGSGMAVTDRRLLRWRPPGAVVSVPLAIVDRVQLDPGRPDGQAMLIVVARDGRPPVTLSLEPRHMAAAGAFTTAVLRAVMDATAAMRSDAGTGASGPGRESSRP